MQAPVLVMSEDTTTSQPILEALQGTNLDLFADVSGQTPRAVRDRLAAKLKCPTLPLPKRTVPPHQLQVQLRATSNRSLAVSPTSFDRVWAPRRC